MRAGDPVILSPGGDVRAAVIEVRVGGLHGTYRTVHLF